MNWFLNRPTRTTLLLGFGALIMTLAVVGGTAYRSITALLASHQLLYEDNYSEVIDVMSMDAHLLRARLTAGTQQSAQVGESIRTLADTITETAQAATQISASSRQQAIGMDQIAVAMENIKQASAQNVAGTRQSETSAQNLHDLGQKLKQLVEQYQV